MEEATKVRLVPLSFCLFFFPIIFSFKEIVKIQNFDLEQNVRLNLFRLSAFVKIYGMGWAYENVGL